MFPPAYDQVRAGGWSQQVDVDIAKPNGSAAAAFVSFSDQALPVIRARSVAALTDRVNMNVIALQGFRYSGEQSIDLAFKGSLHYVNSYDDGVFGESRGEGILGFHYAVWAPSRIVGRDPRTLFDTGYVFDGCGTAGVMARGYVGSEGKSGDTTLAFSLNRSCGGGGVTLNTGDEVYLMVALQSPSNRGGFVDAMSTLRVQYDEENIVYTGTNTQIGLPQLTASLANAVPEPATWGMMILGFGLGGSMARRRSGAANVRA